MTITRRDYAGGAVPTTLASGINSSALSISLTASTGWPAGTNGPFYVVIDRGLSTEEKILVTSRSGVTLTVSGTGNRGVDGTSAQSHAAGAAIEHTLAAADADEANAHHADTTRDDHTQYARKAQNLADLSNAATARTSLGLGSLATKSTVASADITDGTIVTADLADSSVTSAKIVDGTIATGDLADGAVTSAKIADGTIAAADLASNSVTTAKITDANVTTAKIADGSVTAAKLDSALLGVIVCTSGTRPGSPAVGESIYETDTGRFLQYQSATTGWTPPWNTAWGELQYAERTAVQSGITTGSDLTGLSVTINALAHRRIRIVGYICAQGAAGGGLARLDICEGATVLNSDQELMQTSNTGLRALARIVPSAGSHTYKLRFGRTTGSDTLAMEGSATQPCFIQVEDLGSDDAPA